jgi:hypothetical protein
MDPASSQWRPCSSCKTAIPFETTYWVCNVSTCNRKRTGFVFCSVECWDTHLGVVYHRDSYALERRSPSAAQWRREQGQSAGARTAARSPKPASERANARPPRRIVPSTTAAPREERLPRDVLIVSSKLKAYIRARSEMNTSDAALEPLSDAVRRLCDKAIEKARRAERKTVLARDFD